MGTVSEIWRYPVKSMVGERIDRSEVTERGLPGDRAWACRDEVRGGIRGAKKIGPLMLLHARYPGGDITQAPIIRLPDGSELPVDAPEAADAVSKAIDHPVTLWPLLPPDNLEHYRRGRPDTDDRRAEARAVFGLDPEDPFPDFSRMPADLFRLIQEFESPPGTYFDAYPINVLSVQSLAQLARRSPGSAVDVRRFRPNLLVDLPESGRDLPEQEWVGRQVQVGDAVLAISEPCVRCVMIGRATADLPADRDMQKVVVRQLDHTLGVYATVVRAGAVKTGDPVNVLA